jgi:hypothetical protein
MTNGSFPEDQILVWKFRQTPASSVVTEQGLEG